MEGLLQLLQALVKTCEYLGRYWESKTGPL